MIEVRDIREIAAPPELVWEITVDVGAWPTWTPTVTRAEARQAGELAVGCEYWLSQPLQRPAIWRVLEHRPGYSFIWIRKHGRMRLLAEHRVAPSLGGSKSILSLRVDGPAMRLFAPFLRAILAIALRVENRALAAAAETKTQFGEPPLPSSSSRKPEHAK